MGLEPRIGALFLLDGLPWLRLHHGCFVQDEPAEIEFAGAVAKFRNAEQG